MVTIPAGMFWMGCNEAVDDECDGDEHPYHEVYLDAYEIDVTEVTVGQYAVCFEASSCPNPPECNWVDPDADQYPLNCINWYDARVYCTWASKRLCTEAEWEKAARGTDGRKYPWGNEPPTCEQALTDEAETVCGESPSANTPVGSKPLGASPYGVLDMAASLGEWVSDPYDAEYYAVSPTNNPQGPDDGSGRVKRGGASGSPASAMRTSVRFHTGFPESGGGVLGFRCCASPGN